MTVILALPDNPSPPLLQGEQLRASAMSAPVTALVPLVSNVPETLPLSPGRLLAGEQSFAPMAWQTGWPHARLQSQENQAQVWAHALISTPCGALVMVPLGRHLLLKDFTQATNTFTISGQTLTGAGAPLGNVRVMVFETGRLAVDGHPPSPMVSSGNPVEVVWGSESPVVTQQLSDGSGNFSLTVPLNTAYQLTSYLDGVPPRAGITVNTVVPGSVNIYTRDPTVADGAGSGGGMRLAGHGGLAA